MTGRVVALYVAGAAGEPMTAVDEVDAVTGRGLDGDRYAAGLGHYSGRPGSGRHVTLIEQEAVDRAVRDYGVAIHPADTRRNIVTEDVALAHLVGRELRVGDALLLGTRLCEPCAYLEELTTPGVRRSLVHRGGLRAEVVTGGRIRAGDTVTPA